MIALSYFSQFVNHFLDFAKSKLLSLASVVRLHNLQRVYAMPRFYIAFTDTLPKSAHLEVLVLIFLKEQ